MEDIKMKKTYIKPYINLFKIEVPNLCNISANETSGKADLYNTQVNAGDALSREGGLVWELEEVTEEE